MADNTHRDSTLSFPSPAWPACTLQHPCTSTFPGAPFIVFNSSPLAHSGLLAQLPPPALYATPLACNVSPILLYLFFLLSLRMRRLIHFWTCPTLSSVLFTHICKTTQATHVRQRKRCQGRWLDTRAMPDLGIHSGLCSTTACMVQSKHKLLQSERISSCLFPCLCRCCLGLQAAALRLVLPPVRLAAGLAAIEHCAAAAAAAQAACGAAAGGSADAGRAGGGWCGWSGC